MQDVQIHDLNRIYFARVCAIPSLTCIIPWSYKCEMYESVGSDIKWTLTSQHMSTDCIMCN